MVFKHKVGELSNNRAIKAISQMQNKLLTQTNLFAIHSKTWKKTKSDFNANINSHSDHETKKR